MIAQVIQTCTHLIMGARSWLDIFFLSGVLKPFVWELAKLTLVMVVNLSSDVDTSSSLLSDSTIEFFLAF